MAEKIAHISEDGRVQTVKEHLENTAVLAGQFASKFGAEYQATTAGLLHDVGKYSDAFQKRILENGPKVDHSTAGAKEAVRNNNLATAFATAGHHTGIPDGGHYMDDPSEATLCGRNKRQVEPCDDWKTEIIIPYTSDPAWATADPLTFQFYTRMLYSCLVDADFLDTETFMKGQEAPRGEYKTLAELLPAVQYKAGSFLVKDTKGNVVAEKRNEVLKSCLAHGKNDKPGLFELTVPTGGGKTFASLAFAMEHAVQNGMDRIIYVIPYMSIIDQTTAVFSDILGEDNVLAHYSNADFRMRESDSVSLADYRKMLACENWDAPIIVTTAVQFFESLYSNKSSKCRKLHNIANSVVIFDEAQTIPKEYLYPCLSAIDQLVQHYHTTTVLCTATQPVLGRAFSELGSSLSAIRIVGNEKDLFNTLKRTTIKDAGKLTREYLAQTLRSHEQVLCIVNRRKTAQDLFGMIEDDSTFCLTTCLCAHDRQSQLKEIRRKLDNGEPCHVISTSLIEAGVDVSFPTAYREECGLDSLLQAAGRCNRNGERPAENSLVWQFSLSGEEVAHSLAQAISATDFVKRHYDDLLSPEAVTAYFKELLYVFVGARSLDANGILDAFRNGIKGCSFPFEQVSDRFHLIPEQYTVYVPIGEGKALCDALASGEISRGLMRKLGAYSVSCNEDQYEALLQDGSITEIDSNAAILTDMESYSQRTGLRL